MASDGSSSGGSLIGGIIGGVIGFFVGGPAGAAKGFMYGSTIGGLLAPPTGPDQFGPRVESLTITTSTNIATLPRAYGTVAHKGNLIWAKDNEYIEVATTKKVRTGLFSKTKVTTYTYFFTGAFGFCRTEISAVLRIWHAGGRDLVYSATSTDTDTQVASGELTKYIAIYKGTADQGIDPLIAEDVGEASCSAYRGVFYIVYDMYPLENYQNNVGNLDPKVEYTTKAVTAADLDHLVDIPADDADSEQDRFEGLHNANHLSAEGLGVWRIGKGEPTEIAEPIIPGKSLTGEIYHYLAQPDGSLLLKQEYDDVPIAIAPGEDPWHQWTKACKGKSDRNVAVFTRGVIKTGGPGDGGAASHPSLMEGGDWIVSLVGFVWGLPSTISVPTLAAGIEHVLTRNGPGTAGTAEYMFETGEQYQFDDGTRYGVGWRDPGSFVRYYITRTDPFTIDLPITEEMYDGGGSYRFMRYEIRVIDADNDAEYFFRVNVDASVESPAERTFYAFYNNILYFVYTYTDHYVIVKIRADGSKSIGGGSLTTSNKVVKIGILNDQLVVTLNNASACNLDIFDLGLTYIETKDASDVAAIFGASNSGIYNNISFDYDGVYWCRSGRMHHLESFDGTPTDMGAHTGLILGTDAPALFNIFSAGALIADSTAGGTMPNVGVQFFSYGVVSEPGKIPLADIIIAENALVGITEDDLDVTTIDQMVRGYVVSEIGPVRNVLQQLQAIFPWDVIQSGYKNKYVKRGSGTVFEVPWQDLGAGVSLAQDREMETQLPYRLELTYIDIDLDYMPNVQFAERRCDSKHIVRINIPLAMNASEAAQAAEILLNIYHIERRTFVFTLPPTYRNAEPSDLPTLNMKDVSYSLRLTNIHNLANGTMECQAKQHADTVYVSTNPGATGSYTPPTTIPSIANPILGVLDIPVINDAQNKPGYTAVASHPSDGWVGGTVYRARDGVDYQQVQAFNTTTVWGTCIDSLAVHGGHVIDESGSLRVRPLKGALASVTETQFLNDETLLAYGKPGRWEIIAFKDVVDNMDGTYTISYLMRGRKGTEQYTGTHANGDYFAFINDGTAKFISALITDLDQTLKHKAITTGRELDSSSVVNLIYSGVNLTPLSPVDAFGLRDDSDNLTGYFYRRSRVTGGYTSTELLGTDAPLGEATEAYEIDVLDGADVVRTISSTSETFAYSAADQTTDFGSAQSSIDVRIYQISAAVGRGYAGAFTV